MAVVDICIFLKLDGFLGTGVVFSLRFLISRWYNKVVHMTKFTLGGERNDGANVEFDFR